MPDRPSIRRRLIVLSAAIITMVALIAWAARTSWKLFEELAQHIQEEELGSFHIADVFQTNIFGVNYTLVRFATGEAAVERLRFEQQSQELDRWLDGRKAVLTTPREREVLAQIDLAYDIFLAAAKHVIATAEQTNDHRLILDALKKSAHASQPLFDLGTALGAANRDAGQQWREELRHSIRRLQTIIFGSLAGLLSVAAVSSMFIYRHLIAPLRSQLFEARELMARQEKLASLGVLAAGVAHEIRNPLTAIKLRLYTLRQELERSDVGDEDTAVIATEIERLERIVNDFLQFGRPSEPELETLPAHFIPAEVCKLMANQLAPHRVELSLDTDTEAEVRIDPRQLKQVLINLVRNAAESITSSGTVTVRIREISCVLRERREACVCIDVADTGAGIPPHVQKRLFDPFFSTKETGSGLGLSIAARIIEAHGGVLTFETSLGAGTTFKIMLPKHQR